MKLFIDFETRSELPLTGPHGVGAYKYAMHPSTEILCMGYGRPGERINIQPLGELGHPCLGDFRFREDDQIAAHNVGFEYAVYEFILHRRYGWPSLLDPKRWNCTMARAAACGLPLDLDSLGRVLRIKTPKDMEGRRVMQQLCKPVGYDCLGDPWYDNSPDKFERLYAYNAVDVQAEMEVDSLLPELSEDERKVWELDLVANYRGVQVDLEVARNATRIAGELTSKLNTRLKELTDGAVDKATQVESIKHWLSSSQGITVGTLAKHTISSLIADPTIPAKAREVVSIRRQVGKSSTAKYVKAVDTAGDDGRVRGVLQYHAAHTGRWGGRLIQPQNYPKGFDSPVEQEKAIKAILTGDSSAFNEIYGTDSMSVLSDTLRGTIIAAQDHVLVSADYNAIEARVNFWLANDVSALEIYRKGGSLYLDMGEFIYKRPITKKDKNEYAIAKMTILGAGYGMGAKKFRAQCSVAQPEPILISEDMADTAIRSFREKYRSVTKMWEEAEAAAIHAVQNPGTLYPICGGRVTWAMSKDRRFLVCRLPSGRYLRYWKPEVRIVKTPWGEEKLSMCYFDFDAAHQWSLQKTYGGSLVENITQAVARDIMAHGMLEVERAGYPVILTCHDELLAEIPEKYNDGAVLPQFIRTMCEIPSWAAGLPLAAEGWIGKRYRK